MTFDAGSVEAAVNDGDRADEAGEKGGFLPRGAPADHDDVPALNRAAIDIERISAKRPLTVEEFVAVRKDFGLG
ncbi:hypothetical protein ACIQU3_21195 [Streptomyces sp. NPDC101110]|uniref:hypothetical protein n=1 Tax=unclassified Streptomyces TaxID=2593676 RepID=UPI0037FAB6E2